MCFQWNTGLSQHFEKFVFILSTEHYADVSRFALYLHLKTSCCLLSCLKGKFWLEHSVVCSTGCSHEKVRLFTVRFIREWGLQDCISKASGSCWRTTAFGWMHQSKMSPSCPLVTSLQGCFQNGEEKVCNWMLCLCFLKQLKDAALMLPSSTGGGGYL